MSDLTAVMYLVLRVHRELPTDDAQALAWLNRTVDKLKTTADDHGVIERFLRSVIIGPESESKTQAVTEITSLIASTRGIDALLAIAEEAAGIPSNWTWVAAKLEQAAGGEA
jgi:hypothetical protein